MEYCFLITSNNVEVSMTCIVALAPKKESKEFQSQEL